MIRTGRVLAVSVQRYGGEVSQDLPAGTNVVTVGFTPDFDELGGLLVHQPTGEILDYATADPDAGTVTLVGVTPDPWSEGDWLYIYPLANDYVAEVQLDDDEAEAESVEARIDHALRGWFPEGDREPGAGELVHVELTDEFEWVVRDVVNGMIPVLDGGLIDPETLPPSGGSDGNPPDSSPTPTIQGGIGSLFVKWDAVANNDPVTYEVHLSTTTGFNPSISTFAGEVNGTLMSVRRMPDGSPLLAGVTYYARLIAKDVDGAAAPGIEASGQAVQATSDDIAVNAITADQIAANAITADKLESVLVLANRLVAGDPNGAAVELEPAGLRVYGPDGVARVVMNSATGNSLFQGQIQTGQTNEARIVINEPSTVGPTAIRIFPENNNEAQYAEFGTADLTALGGEIGAYINGNPTPSTGQHGALYASPGLAMLAYRVPGSAYELASYVGANWQGQVLGRSAYFDMNLSDQVPLSGASVRSFTVSFSDASGFYYDDFLDIRQSPDAAKRVFFSAPNADVSLYFGNGRIFIGDANGTANVRRDFTCRNIQRETETTVSTRDVKKDVVEIGLDAVDAVVSAPVYSWRYKHDDPELDEKHLGPMAEDLPSEVLTYSDSGELAVDVGSQNALLWEAVRQLAEHVGFKQKESRKRPSKPKTEAQKVRAWLRAEKQYHAGRAAVADRPRRAFDPIKDSQPSL